METTEKFELYSPWALYYQKLQAFFKQDKDVKVLFDNGTPEIALYVQGERKAAALDALLPDSIGFGNVTLLITVVPANWNSGKYVKISSQQLKSPVAFNLQATADLIASALEGNGAVHEIVEFADGEGLPERTYVMFDKEVVQYKTDEIDSLYGYCSTLYEDIAREIFGNLTPAVMFNTTNLTTSYYTPTMYGCK